MAADADKVAGQHLNAEYEHRRLPAAAEEVARLHSAGSTVSPTADSSRAAAALSSKQFYCSHALPCCQLERGEITEHAALLQARQTFTKTAMTDQHGGHLTGRKQSMEVILSTFMRREHLGSRRMMNRLK